MISIKILFLFSAIILICEAQTQTQRVQKQKLRFKLSANNLPDEDTGFGTSDPYVELYYTENGNKKETRFGRTDTITDSENPIWGNIFEFEFDRTKNQKWHLKAYDHDAAREDEGLGKSWVNVEDVIDKGPKPYTTNLHKKGTLTITPI